MSGAALLIPAVVAAAAAWLIGWPAWRAVSERRRVDLNAERYNAWRGRASRGPLPSAAPSSSERLRLIVGAALAVVAAALVIGFLVGA